MKIKKLKDLREDSDLLQKDVAKILNIKQSAYSLWETGINIIPLKQLNKLCNYYNVSFDYILGFTDNKNNDINNFVLDKKTIGKNIKTFREKYNLTLRDVAKELNTTSSTISAYETGKTLILTAFAYQICKNYNISMDWLVGRSEIMNLK